MSRPKKTVAKKTVTKKTVEKPKKVKIEKVEESMEKDTAKKVMQYAALRGMHDITPHESRFWNKLRKEAEEISFAYGYSYIETPLLESASLFIRSVGKETDIVEKEMYVFDGYDSGKIALRPEATASVVRSYIENGLRSMPQPVKVWYFGPMFRHERPQANRFREFHQFGCEIIGDERNPAMDAELINVAFNFLKDLGIETSVKINSIGRPEDRERYIVELVSYLRTKKGYLCADCKRRLLKNPLRVLDCKIKTCQTVLEEAPQIVDWLGDESKKFFMTVLEYLDASGVPYVLESKLVRGLDYYTDTVFELFPVLDPEKNKTEETGSQSALAAGGRYDKLVEELGGESATACGFAIGLERVATILKARRERDENEKKEFKFFFAQLGDQARKKSLLMIENLRREGIVVAHNLAKSSLKAQLEIANKLQVPFTLILGQREVQDETIIIRDMESGIQEIIDEKKLKIRLRKIIEQLDSAK